MSEESDTLAPSNGDVFLLQSFMVYCHFPSQHLSQVKIKYLGKQVKENE
jgi:hypothetical protein